MNTAQLFPLRATGATPVTVGGFVVPLAVSIRDAQSLIGVGRTKIWELIAAGEIEVIHIGRRVLVPYPALVDYINGVRDQEAQIAKGTAASRTKDIAAAH